MNILRHTVWKAIIRIRPVIVGLWMLSVSICYVYFYAQSLWTRYPALHEFQQVGAWEMIRRILTP